MLKNKSKMKKKRENMRKMAKIEPLKYLHTFGKMTNI